jgi:hypothetical protein
MLNTKGGLRIVTGSNSEAGKETSFDDNLRIHNLDMPEKERRFLADLVSRCQGKIGDELISILLFGSAVKGGFVEGVSDFDMIIVVDDGMTSGEMNDLASEVERASSEHDMVGSTSEGFRGIPRFIMRESGMFVSYFICREGEFVSADFSRIFHTNPLLMKLIVPKGIVFGNVLKGLERVYGKDVVSVARMPRPTKLDILKSVVMNELLVLLSLIYHPFTQDATKLAMEATKWSVFTASYWMTGESRSLSEGIGILSEEGISAEHLRRLDELRKEYRRDWSFAFSTLKEIPKIHFSLLTI